MDRATILEIHELHARLCKAIADPKRLLIINQLRDGAMTVGELSEALGITASNCSQHLAILRDRGVVTAERSGTSVRYSLRGMKVLQAVDLLREFMAEEIGTRSRLGRAARRTPSRLAQA